MEDNMKLIDNLLADLRKYREQMDVGNLELWGIANVLDSAIADIEVGKEDILYRRNKHK